MSDDVMFEDPRRRDCFTTQDAPADPPVGLVLSPGYVLCPICHGDRTMEERVGEVWVPIPCRQCEGEGSITQERFDDRQAWIMRTRKRMAKMLADRRAKEAGG